MQSYIMPTYGRKSISFKEGKGMWLTDTTGNTYLDLVSGVAVNCLGHSSEVIANALIEQANKVVHISNLYWNEPQLQLAAYLIELSQGDLKDVFFCNSGTEALEGALKICKKYGKAHHKPYLIYMENSFHGRTNGALSITGQPKYQEPFGDLLPDCIHIPFNDMVALEKLFHDIGDEIAAVFVEPVQGEGGVITAEADYLKQLSALCKAYDALLVFDEVQCGAGRLGTYYAYQSFGVTPDVVCMAKGLGGGVPIGAFIANEKASVLSKGDHGSTYGGNPLMCNVSLAVTKTITQPAFQENLKKQSEILLKGFSSFVEKGLIQAYRGSGLLLGLVVENPGKLVDLAFDSGLLLISAGSDTVRILPPLNIQEEDALLILEKLESVLVHYASEEVKS